MKILISPYSRALKNGKNNPKNYPYFQEVISTLKSFGHEIIQVGVTGETPFQDISNTKFNSSLKELKELVASCDVWVSVDNFFQHFCWLHQKYGVVIFSQSDPEIFGHVENTNLLKDKKFLRPLQFDIWESATYTLEAYVPSEVVVEAILSKETTHVT